jgi:hypothetical protein
MTKTLKTCKGKEANKQNKKLFKYKGLRIIIETGGVTQAVDHLLCNCEALSSNPCPTKKKWNNNRMGLNSKTEMDARVHKIQNSE